MADPSTNVGLRTSELSDQIVALGIPIKTIRRFSGSPPTIVYDDTATAQQISQAEALKNSLNWTDAGDTAWLASKQANQTTLRTAAANAVSNNQAFIALASPTPAQVANQVKSLTQQVNQIIKRLIEIN